MTDFCLWHGRIFTDVSISNVLLHVPVMFDEWSMFDEVIAKRAGLLFSLTMYKYKEQKTLYIYFITLMNSGFLHLVAFTVVYSKAQYPSLM